MTLALAPPTNDEDERWQLLALRVVEQAVVDLGLPRPEQRASAARFLRDELWHPQSIWGPWLQALGLRRPHVVAVLEEKLQCVPTGGLERVGKSLRGPARRLG